MFANNNSNLITNVPLNTLCKNIFTTQSISDYNSFWNYHTNEVSKKLWLPSLNNQNNDVICEPIKSLIDSNISTYYGNNKSYESINFMSVPNLVAENNTTMITRKIRIYPNKNQKLFFNKCFGATRYTYNKVVSYINKQYSDKKKEINNLAIRGCISMTNGEQCCNQLDTNYFCDKHKKSKINYDFKLNLPFIRSQIFVNDKDLSEEMQWLKEVPYDTRQLIIKDFIAAYKAAMSNLRNHNINSFSMGYKSKKNSTQIFHIDKRAIEHDLTIFKRRKIGKLRARKKMKKWLDKNVKTIDCDCKIIKYKPDQYYLLLTMNKKMDIQTPVCKSVALDPGVRTFHTFFSPDGITGKLGDNFAHNRLLNIAKKLDNLDTIKSKTKNTKTKKHIRQRQALLRTKIKNVVNDLHWKTINFLVKNFQTILLPTFEVSNMIQLTKKIRKINNTTVRNMLSLSHYSFKLKLKYKCESLGRNLLIVNESYTSQLCGNCGKRNRNLGAKKEFHCNECNIKMDRDTNGARNIMLKTCSGDYDISSIK